MGQLAQVLREVQPPTDERLLVGPEDFDDAGVVLLGEREGCAPGSRVALVQTTDFFPPVVDDPWFYGAISAANALSDVYAMGGLPLSALSLASFPAKFEPELIARILQGGCDKLRESGAVLAGGHTVEGNLNYGMAVTGTIDPTRVMAHKGAVAGDVVYLTKSIGMGCVTTAAKFGKIEWQDVLPAAEQMAALNDAAALAMNAAGAHACTDVTGFGLIGHGSNIARASALSLRIETSALPLFPLAPELARAGHFSGGVKRGKQALGEEVRVAGDVPGWLEDLCYDAETSGGLLIVLPEERAGALEAELVARGLPVHLIGSFVERSGALVELV